MRTRHKYEDFQELFKTREEFDLMMKINALLITRYELQNLWYKLEIEIDKTMQKLRAFYKDGR